VKSLGSPVAKLRKEAQNVQIAVVGGGGALMGHSMLSAMSPFDRAHTTSYSTLIETMRLSFTVFEI